MLPKTFMNNSGAAVSKAINYYKIDMKGLMVVHDEADMLIGKSKLGFSHSAAGHRGIDSVIQNLKTQSF
jgi:PTH1 family peptidyl-tRNA hydrolase